MQCLRQAARMLSRSTMHKCASIVASPVKTSLAMGTQMAVGREVSALRRPTTLAMLPRSSPIRRNLSGRSKVAASTNSDQEYRTIAGADKALAKATEKKEDEPADGQKVACEFVTQAVFNFLSCSAVAQAAKMSAGDAVVQTLMVMGAHAFILPLVIYSAMSTSGAHFNPMVTSCFVALGKLPWKVGLAYVIAQLAGGVIGAAAAFSSLPQSMQTLAHAGIQAVPPTSTVGQAFMGEIYGAFALIFVLCATNLDPRCNWGKLAPLSIPMVIILLMWILGPVSSMCINPARAFGPALVTGFWEHHWIRWTAPFIGGLSAAKIYQKVLLPKGITL